jgi:hypothetical protein
MKEAQCFICKRLLNADQAKQVLLKTKEKVDVCDFCVVDVLRNKMRWE